MEIKENSVYFCDCKELMKEMIKQGIKADWLITDPPYGIKVDKMTFTKGAKSPYHRTDFSNITAWDRRLDKEYFDLMFECSKEQIIFGGNYYTDYLPPTKSWIVWDKRCQDIHIDFADCELAFCSTGVARVFRYLYNGYLQGDIKHKDVRFHPTQKPTQIITQLINYYTKPNDLILDPFMGSFTTAESCIKTGRRYIGAENDPQYFEKGSDRIRLLKQQTSIFDI